MYVAPQLHLGRSLRLRNSPVLLLYMNCKGMECPLNRRKADDSFSR